MTLQQLGNPKVPYDFAQRKRKLELPFTLQEYRRRIRKISRFMERHGVKGLIIFGDPNGVDAVRYVSNFELLAAGLAVVVLPVEGAPVLITNSVFHGEPAHSMTWTTWIRDYRPIVRDPDALVDATKRALDDLGIANETLGFVGNGTMSTYYCRQLQGKLRLKTKNLTSGFHYLKGVREEKEIGYIERATTCVDAAAAAALERIKEGTIENEVAAAAVKEMFERGAHEMAFSVPVVCSGPRSGIKHSYPTPRKLRRGDMIYVDFGARYFGYESHIARSTVVGGSPTKDQRDLFEILHSGYNEIKDAMKPGTRVIDLKQLSEKLERQSGIAKRFPRRGFIQYVLDPALQDDWVLTKNLTFGYEPMIVITDYGLVVFKDFMLVGSRGTSAFNKTPLLPW